jgi:hypothetical protein
MEKGICRGKPMNDLFLQMQPWNVLEVALQTVLAAHMLALLRDASMAPRTGGQAGPWHAKSARPSTG